MGEEKTLIFEDEFLRDGFTQIPNTVLKNNSLSMQARLLYGILLSYAWEKNECFPGEKALAEICGVSERHIRTLLNELKKRGFIEIKDRRPKTNLYIIKSMRNYSSGYAEQDFRFNRNYTSGEEDSVEEDSHNTSTDWKLIENFFNSLWQQYPRKRGKGSVSPTQKKKLYKIGQAHLERAINRFKKEMEQEGRPIDKYPYGSTFFNSAYVDYLDENYTPQKKTDASELMTAEELRQRREEAK